MLPDQFTGGGANTSNTGGLNPDNVVNQPQPVEQRHRVQQAIHASGFANLAKGLFLSMFRVGYCFLTVDISPGFGNVKEE